MEDVESKKRRTLSPGAARARAPSNPWRLPHVFSKRMPPQTRNWHWARLHVERRRGVSTAHRYLPEPGERGSGAAGSGQWFLRSGPCRAEHRLAALRRVDAVDIAARHMKNLTLEHTMSAAWPSGRTAARPWCAGSAARISRSTHWLSAIILPIDNTACGLVFQAFLPPAQIAAARDHQPAHFRGSPPDAATLEEISQSCWAEKTSHLLSNVTVSCARLRCPATTCLRRDNGHRSRSVAFAPKIAKPCSERPV